MNDCDSSCHFDHRKEHDSPSVRIAGVSEDRETPLPIPPNQSPQHRRGFLMKNTAPEVDLYISNAAEFARPILRRLRKLFHQASPQIREEISRVPVVR